MAQISIEKFIGKEQPVAILWSASQILIEMGGRDMVAVGDDPSTRCSAGRALVIIFSLVYFGAMIACATTQDLRKQLQTKSTKEQTFRACAQAIVGAGFSIVSTDSGSGVISAQRVFMQSSKTTQYITLDIVVNETSAGTVVEVSLKNPAGIGLERDFDKFVQELKRKVPDAIVISGQSTS